MNRVPKTIVSVAALALAGLAVLTICTDGVDDSMKGTVAAVGVISVLVAVLFIGGTK